jgi:hypothetical protein
MQTADRPRLQGEFGVNVSLFSQTRSITPPFGYWMRWNKQSVGWRDATAAIATA